MPQTTAKDNHTSLESACIYYHQNVYNSACNIPAVSVLILCCFPSFLFSLKFIAALLFVLFLLFYLLKTQDAVSVASPKTSDMPANQPQPARLVIYSGDVMNIHNCSSSTASRKLQLVKVWLQKKDYQEVTIKEYCDYWGLNYLETCEFLKLLK